METDERLRSPFGNLRSAHSCYLIFIVAGNLHPCFLNSLLHEITEIPKTKSPVPFRFRKKHGVLSVYNCLQALEALAAVIEQGGVIGDAAGDVQGGVNRFGQARQSRCAAA